MEIVIMAPKFDGGATFGPLLLLERLILESCQ
jgi:hypothetical protein